MTTNVASGGSSSAAAAEAAQRAAAAAAAARRAAAAAAAARKAAEAARKASEAARTKAQSAAKNLGQSRKDLVHGEQQLQNAKPAQREAAKANVEKLRGQVDSAKNQLKTANRALLDAEDKQQKAEEDVAKASKTAQDAMTSANTAASKIPGASEIPGGLQPYTQNDIAKAGVHANEIRDAFDGADATDRAELSKKLGVDASTDTKEIQAGLDANKTFDQLKQDPTKSKTLDQLNIRSGQDLRNFGQNLAAQADGTQAKDAAGKNALNLKGVQDKDALASIIQTAGNTLTDPAAKTTVTGELFAKQVANGQDPNKAAHLKGMDLAVAVQQSEMKGIVNKPVGQWTAADASKYTKALADQVEKYKSDPEAVEALMTMSGKALQRSAQLVGKFSNENGNKDDVLGLTANLSRIGNAAPQRAAAQLAIGIAKEIPEDSEQHYVDDGFGKFIDDGGPSRFRDTIAAALKQQGKDDAADELVNKSAGGGIGGIVSDVWDSVKDAGKFLLDKAEDAASAAYNFVSKELIGKLGDSLRNAAADALNIDGQINKLKSEGDSFTAKAGVDASLFGADLGAGVQFKVTKTASGYSMELEGEGSAGVASKLKLPGLGGTDLSATGTASATVKFDFKNAADVEKASNTVAGVAMGVAATAAGGPLAPLGAAMVASAGDELGFIGDHYASTTLQLEQKAEVSAEVGDQLGLPGATVGGSVSSAEAIEIPRSGPPNLILNQKVGVNGDLDIAGAVPLPSGGELSPGKVGGSAEISMETKVPINLSPGDLISDPVGALKKAGKTAVDQSTTTLSADVQFNHGAEISGGPVTLGKDQGMEVSLSAEAKTKDLVGALGKALTGNLSGALSSLGKDVTVEGEVRAFNDDKAGFEKEGIDIGIASVDVTAEAETRSSKILTDFNGTPAQLLKKFGGVINGVNFTQTA